MLFESHDIVVFVATERDQVSWWIRSKYDKDRRNWFSIDLVAQLLEETLVTGIMDSASEVFLRKNCDVIIEKFQRSAVGDTLRLLDELKKIRTDRLMHR